MALNLDAIREKVARLNGEGKKYDNKTIFWKPEPREEPYLVRIVPWTGHDEPFKELWFYYNIIKQGLLAPKQFKKPDPFQDFINQLHQDGSAESKELAKKLYPKARTFAPVIVRGEEDKGVQLWSFGVLITKKLYGYMLDEDYGDITDLENGFDLKVKITQPPGRYRETEVDIRPRTSAAYDDGDKLNEWLNNIPEPLDAYKLKEYDELEKILQDYIMDGSEDNNNKSNMQSNEQNNMKVHGSLDDAFADALGTTA